MAVMMLRMADDMCQRECFFSEDDANTEDEHEDVGKDDGDDGKCWVGG